MAKLDGNDDDSNQGIGASHRRLIHMQYALYMATAVGAVALYLMMPQRSKSTVRLGMLLGAATVGGLWMLLSRELPQVSTAMAYFYTFSAIAVGAAARVITHSKPVYSALWFIMVILASAGLFLTLEAEFMAFALIMIYGGAILVTYVFVIMLAASSGDPADEEQATVYDSNAREPGAALVVGFILLSVLLSVAFEPAVEVPEAHAAADKTVIQDTLTNRAVARLAEKSEGELPAVMSNKKRLENLEAVGLDLFEKHPLGLELAGVILLVALVGAVVIARKQVEAQPEA